ncbi:MAG: tandem-95 repeat protein [Chloroflexi bacterium]|nr:tandem-95 repeat protein [Chloroflexota bacterium]
MQVAAVGAASNGTVSNNTTDVSYQPNADYCGPDSFTYTLNGGSTATVNVTVNCVDDAPVAVNDNATLTEDDPATIIDVLANDTDIDSGPMQVVSVGTASNGSVTNNTTDVSYQPDADFCGNDSFTYTLNGGSTATVNVTVNCVDDAPVAVNDNATLTEDDPATIIDVLANDTDIDSGPMQVASVGSASNGSVTNNTADVSYQPDADFCGSDSFTYTLNGGSTATVNVTVNCVDDAPVAVNDNATLTEDDPATVIDVLANDTDIDGGPMQVASVSAASSGTVINNTTDVSYQPNVNFCGSDSFTYTLNGGSTATVNVTVNCVDDAPIAVNDNTTLTEDDPATIVDVLANDTDIDGGSMQVASVGTAANGTVVNNTTDVSYQPDADFCGSDSFTYTLNGGSTATVNVTVTCVDDAPVAVNDNATVTEDDPATIIDVLANDTDVDGGLMQVASVGAAANGTVVNNTTDVSYQPDADYCGSDSFTYTLNGGSTATVNVTVNCVDDNPVAVNDNATLTEDDPATIIDVLANDTDIDGGPMQVASVSAASNGTVINNTTDVSYQPDADFCGNDSFTYTLNGGSTATVNVAVNCVDDAPVAINDSATFNEDDPATTIDILANDTDIDGGPMQVASVSAASNGTVTNNTTDVSYQPDVDFCGGDSFTYTLNGGSTATVNVTVNCVDDAPVAINDSATFNEDDPATTIDVLANDTDVDGGLMQVASVGAAANGTVVNNTTNVSYQPDADFCGSDSFTYTLNGGSTATVNVTVNCVDDAPIAVNDNATLTEDDPATIIDVLANDTDIDGGLMQVASVGSASNGTVSNNTTDVSYQPDANFCGSDSFTYTLNGGSTATVNVTVNCVDDAPVAINDNATLTEDDPATIIDVLANDTDIDGGPMQVASVGAAANGTVVNNTTNVSYQPDADFCGPDSFTYTLNGGSTATVNITVTCANDSPIAVNDSATFNEDDPAATIDVLANDIDIDGGPMQVAAVGAASNGTVSNNTTDVSYQPNADFCGPDSFTYTLNGGSTAIVNVTVNCVNDAPAFTAGPDQTVNEDAGAQTVAGWATGISAGPADESAQTLTFNVSNDNNALFSVQPAVATNGTLSYTPAPNANGSATVTLSLSDNGGTANGGVDTSAPQTFTITVNPVDDLPLAADDSVTANEDDPASAVDVLANDTDVEGDPITVVSVTQSANGVVVNNGTNVTYQPDADFCGSDSFTYTVNGGSTATVGVTVNCADDSPVAVDDSATLNENDPATLIDVLANDTDVDGGTMQVTSVGAASNGTVTNNTTSVSYQPDTGFCGGDSFTYTLNGGSTATVDVTINCTDDPPSPWMTTSPSPATPPPPSMSSPTTPTPTADRCRLPRWEPPPMGLRPITPPTSPIPPTPITAVLTPSPTP